MCYKLIRLGFCRYRFGIALKREKDVLKRENDDMQMLLYVKKELVGDLRQIYFFKWKAKFGLEINLYIYIYIIFAWSLYKKVYVKIKEILGLNLN